MKTLLKLISFIFPVLIINPVFSQETPEDTLISHIHAIRSDVDFLKRIKLSGYMQAQFQVADSGGAASFNGGNFASGTDKRFQLRRARVKVQYDSPLNEKGWSTSQFVFQIDATQNGLTIKDMYLKFTDPWSGWFSLTAGMQNRPFGYEVPYSSGLRESPERGRMSQIIFPNERDLGAMLTIQGSKLSNWNWIKLEMGMFNGTGAPSAGANTSDFDKFKDFIGHLTITRTNKSEMVKWGLGASIYNGGFRQEVANNYIAGTDPNGVNGFKIDIPKADINTKPNAQLSAKREYVGVDGQVSIDWFLGITTLRAEYIQGKQPGTSSSTVSPAALPVSSLTTFNSTTTIDSLGNATTTTTSTTTTTASDIYLRNFNGAYFYFVQALGSSPWQAVVKYDWYDPNTDVEGDELGKSVASGFRATNGADVKFTTLGLGLAYRWDAYVKLTAYYDMVTNETSQNLNGFTQDISDNIFTLRAQFKF